MLLDDFMPVYHFNEVHSVVVRAPPDRIFRAIKEVQPNEIPLFSTLFWIRSLPSRLTGKGGSSFLGTTALLEQMVSGDFLLLAEEANRELVLGTIGQFWKLRGGLSPNVADAQEFLAFDDPNYAKATMNLSVAGPDSQGSAKVVTETRIYIPDPTTRKKFAAYWRLVHPGSAIIRKMWLRAIKRRAEKDY